MGIVFTRLFASLFGNKEARILVLGLDNAGKTTILYRLQMGEVVSTIPTIGFNVETVQYNNVKFQVWDLGGQTSIRCLVAARGFVCFHQVIRHRDINEFSHTPVPVFLFQFVFLVSIKAPNKIYHLLSLLSYSSSQHNFHSDHIFVSIYFFEVIYLERRWRGKCGGKEYGWWMPYWRCYFPNTQAIIYVVDSSDTDRLVVAKEEFHAILEEEELKGAVVLIYANKQDLPGALDDAPITEALELHKIKNRQWAIFKTSAVKGEGLFEGLDWLSSALKLGGG